MTQLISALPNKAKIKFGTYYGEPIIWQKADANHTGFPANSVSLITANIICLKAFDAKESANSDSNRKNYGNNDYVKSNIRQWLNATSTGWYTAQHSADAPPNSANVWSGYNPYDTEAGFLAGFTEQERNAILSTTRTIGGYSGNDTSCTDKVFLWTTNELGLETRANNGTLLPIFSSNADRVCKPTAKAVEKSNYTNSSFNVNSGWYYWSATSNPSYSNLVYVAHTDGSLYYYHAYHGNNGVRPGLNLSSSILVSDSTDGDGCYTVVWNQPPSAPSTITVPESVYAGKQIAISWGKSTDPEGTTVTYTLERKYDEATWVQAYKGSALTFTDTIEKAGHTKVQYRVKATDTAGSDSAYTTSQTRTVNNNSDPVIAADQTSLGDFSTDPPTWSYTVTDVDEDTVTVKEYLDGALTNTKTVVLSNSNELTIAADKWREMANGEHTFKVDADDGQGGTATKSATFTKAVTEIMVQLKNPMAADAMPTKAMIGIQGAFPPNSVLKVEICNNANDAEPTWEDCTRAAQNSTKFYFQNKEKTDESWAVSVRANLKRMTAVGDCYITSLSGNFG